jgi:RNA polymerase sigma factor (sigma-70 family)
VPGTEVEGLLRRLAPQVLGAVVRRYGHFDTAEDATQEALLAAAMQWPDDGVPEHPRGWLITVASRRLTDLLRSEQARQRREDTVASHALPEQWLAPAADRPPSDADDTLVLLFMCCHPVLSPASQIALTLRAVGGLTTAEIARAFLVPEATMTRRISRAKQRIRDSGIPFAMPRGGERSERLAAVLHVLYLIFNEGYASTSGPELHRAELSAEAIRLARMVHRLLPDDGEATGLLALMLLTDARRPARTGPDGGLVPMAEQDRSRWNADDIAEGVALITGALPRGPTGPYQLQAAIAAVHASAPCWQETDWLQIATLYDVLASRDRSPVVALNRAVAHAKLGRVEEALGDVDALAPALSGYHLWHATRAELLRELGRDEEAAAADMAALALTDNPGERRLLQTRLRRYRLSDGS